MAPSVDPPPFVHLSRPNRSLGIVARRWVLGMIAATTLGVAAGAMAFGAWPVMPFAGLEVAFLAFAFRVLGQHDADFERLEVGEHEVRLEARDASRHTRFVAHRPWARVEMAGRGTRCTLRLAYAGRTVPLGRMLSDEGRRQLAESLRGRMTVTAKYEKPG
ncbi:MAG TPA: DUF2244 domain-containing protein [Ramlibacter sp.]